MNIKRWITFRYEKELAQTMVETLVKTLPPSHIDTKKKGLTVNRITTLLERNYRQACEYQEDHKIGFIKRAYLANKYKWALLEAGYATDFVDLATEGLIVLLTKASKEIKSQ